MKYPIQCFILAAGVIILIFLFQSNISHFSNRKYIRASFDGKLYQIVNSFEGGTKAANNLAQINTFLLGVLKHMKKKYVNNPSPRTYVQRVNTQRLLDLYNPDVLRENNPAGPINTSFVINKGDEIAFCLREKYTGENKLHDFETLKFVALHEMAHIMTIAYGHEDDFWQNFKFLVNEAAETGTYVPVDYKKYPIDYCSLKIDYNPLYDDTLAFPF